MNTARRTLTARPARKTLTITIEASGKITAVDARGAVYLADGTASAQGADVGLYLNGITLVGRLVVDNARAFFA